MFFPFLRKEQVGDFKEVLNRCAYLKEEIEKLLGKSVDLNDDTRAEINNTLTEYEKTKEEVLKIKNNSSLRPKEKILEIASKKDIICQLEKQLEISKQMLEERLNK